jgi:hypothetical protein
VSDRLSGDKSDEVWQIYGLSPGWILELIPLISLGPVQSIVLSSKDDLILFGEAHLIPLLKVKLRRYLHGEFHLEHLVLQRILAQLLVVRVCIPQLEVASEHILYLVENLQMDLYQRVFQLKVRQTREISVRDVRLNLVFADCLVFY